LVIATPDKSSYLEAVGRSRTPSPATSDELHPITPPQVPQPKGSIVLVKPELHWAAKPAMTTTTKIAEMPSAQGPSVSPKPKKQKQVEPNPPGTGKKAKKRAAALLALAAMKGNATMPQSPSAQCTEWDVGLPAQCTGW